MASKVLLLFPLLACGFWAVAQDVSADSNGSPQRTKNVAAGEKEIKRLLLLMDKDRNGKVSKQEFMTFMEAEFARLDKNNDGELDVKELTQIQIRFRTPSHR